MRVSIPEYLIVSLMLAIGSCQPKPPAPPPINPAIFEADCRAIYQQELGRDPEPEGLTGCERRIVDAKLAGAPVPQEVFRAWVREQPEWKARQKAIDEAKQVVVLPRLRARGSFIEQDNGQWFTLIDATHFSLYAKYKEGQDIDPLLKQVSDLDFNSLRIFGVSQNNWPEYQANLTLARYGESYYADLPAFFQKLAKYHLYGNFVAFISDVEIPGEAAQLVHWARLVEALRGISNVLLSAINEDSAHTGHQLPSLFKLPRPVGVFSSRGSNGGSKDGANGLPPPGWPSDLWDFHELHFNDVLEYRRKAHNCWEQDKTKPCVGSEWTRAPDRMTSTETAFDIAASCTLLTGGCTFHSWLGRSSTLWDAQTIAFAKAWVAGAKSIPLSCQAGDYRHGTAEQREENWPRLGSMTDDLTKPRNPEYDPRRPTYLRVFARGADPSCVVRIR